MQGDFRLGQWFVCPKLNTIQADGRTIRLEPKFMQVLICLAAQPGEVVSKEELIRAVWVDTFVTDDVLTRSISELRRALQDDAKQPHVIETVARNGYRIIAPVQRIEESSAEAGGNRVYASGRRAKIVAAAVAAVAIVIVAAVVLHRKPTEVQTNSPKAIAVLPLQNTSGAKDLDFLRIGLADDIANTLSYYPAVSIRPFATANKYAGADVDLQKAAQEMRVAEIVTGHFVVEGSEIEVTLEAVDPASNRVLWRDSLRGPVSDLIGIQQQITTRVQHGLIVALGVNAGASPSSNTSRNSEAYELYLRAMSEADSHTSFSEGNRNSIRLLQRAVAIDPGYSSAWATLGHLYYYDIGFGGGGVEAKLKAKAALQRAVALDPGRIDAATDLINMESEEGNLNGAYDDISKLLRQRPDSGAVHLVYSYVLWYAGLLDEAANECEKARSLDAGTTDLASCASVFMGLNRYERAREYLQLLSGSEFQISGEVELLLREGKNDAALQMLKSLPATVPLYGRQYLEPCLLHHPATAAEADEARKLNAGLMADDDPGPKYSLAAWYSLCSQPDLAYPALRKAIAQDYCAYPQMETDPLLEKVRAMPEFAEIRSSGIACQQHFLEHRKQSDSKSN
jgi:DNA-binding winged helix-turn-helix (wHTH) protein/TolB-like protein/tetratricopeptide (TPR) repeat protein